MKAIAMGLKGDEVASLEKVSPVTIDRWKRQERLRAMIEDARQRFADKLLHKAEVAIDSILDSDAATLQEDAKGHNIKLKASMEIAKGLGVLQTHSDKTIDKTEKKLDLSAYLELREARSAQNEKVVEGEVIKTEAIEPPQEAPSERH